MAEAFPRTNGVTGSLTPDVICFAFWREAHAFCLLVLRMLPCSPALAGPKSS